MSSHKKKQLRKHKRIATGLFFLMAVIYTLMIYFQQHNPQKWMGYVEAFSEAGMVGALADWFAVTALFKHPLGLPIPHTNLIERKKNDLGKNLGMFVNENFINPKNIRPYIEKLDVAKLIVDWLNKSKNRLMLETEIANLLNKIIDDLEDDQVENFLTQQGTELLKNIDYQSIASSGIEYMVKNKEHINLLETLLPQLKTYIQENEQLILDRIADNRPLIAFLAGKKISREITEGIISFIEEIEKNPHHFVREKLTLTLLNFSADLTTTQKWEDKFSKFKTDFIHAENLKPYTQDAWQAIKNMLQKQLENPNSKLKEYIGQNIDKLAKNLKEDQVLQYRLNHWIQHFAYRMVLKNRQEIETLISTTVEGWEGKELSDKLELEVGKDLQFIRINGTLVGGLMGLFIYLITQLFI